MAKKTERIRRSYRKKKGRDEARSIVEEKIEIMIE